MVPTLPLRFNSTGAAQRKAPIPRKARDYFFRLNPLHSLPLMAGVTRITTKNFQKLSELSQVVQRLQGAFLTGIP